MNGLVFKNGRWVMLCGSREYPMDYRDPSGQKIKVAESATADLVNHKEANDARTDLPFNSTNQ